MKSPLGRLALGRPLALLLLGLLLLTTLTCAAPPTTSSELSYCKCNCFGNSTTLPLYFPTDPVHPCLTCTKQWCLDQKLPICVGAKAGDGDLDTGTGKEGSDVEALCFKRGSPRDQTIVTLFLITVFGLLATAFVRRHLDRQQTTPGEVWERLRTTIPPWASGGAGAGRGAGYDEERDMTQQRGYAPISSSTENS